MKALVLGGGSLKGAWQVGAIQAVLETGFKPDMIYGISAGALNASFMVNQTVAYENTAIDWIKINQDLLKFWLEHINKPEDIGLLKSKLSLGMDTLWSRFDGLLDTNPLNEKIREFIKHENLQKSKVKLKIGAVDINTGHLHYIDPSEPYFHDYLRASSSLPIIMPGIQIGNNHKKVFLDGGLREVVPLRKAILDGATEVYAVATHPEVLDLEPINHRNLLSLIERIKDISVNQFENNDLDWAENYEKGVFELAGFSLKKKINIKVIRPERSVKLNLTSFGIEDIKTAIKEGYERGYTVLHPQG